MDKTSCSNYTNVEVDYGDKISKRIYSVLDFLNWYNSNQIDIDYKESISTITDEEIYKVISCIIHRVPLPQIILTLETIPDELKIIRKIIYGEKLIAIILSFVNSEIVLNEFSDYLFAGYRYDDLSDRIKENLLTYELFITEVKDSSRNQKEILSNMLVSYAD
ncbi:MAG: hypothetical protein N4A40_12810 [Tissierellales bacterium]|nr:hypothetical protein [Tissierellales bacterium]